MKSPLSFARSNGWPTLISHMSAGLHRRMRDQLIARQLRAPGFRTGRVPRLLGLSHVQIGPDFHAGDALWLEAVLDYAGQSFAPRLAVGAHARLSDNVHIGCLDRITIGDHLLCGSRVLISDHAHGQYGGSHASPPSVPPAERPLWSAGPVTLGDNVWLGDGVAVLAGAQIGTGCVIGANAVVTGVIPPQTIAVGAPARPIRAWSDNEQAWLPIDPPAKG